MYEVPLSRLRELSAAAIRTNGHGKPVVALDIDGTLGDYHGHFLGFATNWFGRSFPDPKEINPGRPLWDFMGVSKAEYREAKLAYRQGGWKRWMPAYPGAMRLTRSIREAGAEVWICTTRPYLRLDNIDPDTREWLRRNKIQYDAVLFDLLEEKGSKYRELKRQAGERVCSIVDDLPEYLVLATEEWPECGSPGIYLRDQPYNRHADRWPRFRDLVGAWGQIESDIKSWISRRGER